MAIYNDAHHVIKFQSGEVWDFSAEQNNEITYRRLNQNGLWDKPLPLVSNIQDDFSVKIDSMNHLHLVCCSTKGELYYFLFDGEDWAKQILSRFEPIRYVVRYPIVIPIKNKIHILFAMGTTFNTGYWSLYHYYWDETAWHFKEVTQLTAGYRLIPFCADLSEKYIHMVYRGLATQQYQVFYCRYHLEHGIWSNPENVTQSIEDCDMPSLLIRDDLLHLTWISLSKNNLIVNYKNKSIGSLDSLEWNQPQQLNSIGSNVCLPHFIWAEGKLWCIWYQADNLIGCCSENQGESWNLPAVLPGFDKTSFHNIHYSTNQMKEKQLFQLQWILGKADKSLSLPVINVCIELPEYSPAPPAAAYQAENINAKKITANKESAAKASPNECSNKTNNVKKKVDAPKINAEAGESSPMETKLFSKFDNQEKIHRSVIAKLEEQSKTGDAALEEIRQILSFEKQNCEMLQALKKDMEQIKQDIQQFKTRGFFKRLFHSS